MPIPQEPVTELRDAEETWKDDDEPMELLHFTHFEQNLMSTHGYGAVRVLRKYNRFSEPTVTSIVSDFEEWATQRATFILPEASPMLSGTGIMPWFMIPDGLTVQTLAPPGRCSATYLSILRAAGA